MTISKQTANATEWTETECCPALLVGIQTFIWQIVLVAGISTGSFTYNKALTWKHYINSSQANNVCTLNPTLWVH